LSSMRHRTLASRHGFLGRLVAMPRLSPGEAQSAASCPSYEIPSADNRG
jgi:hypothetical protein